MHRYDDYKKVLDLLQDSKASERDVREEAHACTEFIELNDGQWEPEIYKKFGGKPRYTFDITTPIVDQIAKQLEQTEFSNKILPSNSGASRENAIILDSILRKIEKDSGAKYIYKNSARGLVSCGIDGWRIVQKYTDDSSFDQDLAVEQIYNFVERVWYDPAAARQDKADARYVFIEESLSSEDYEEKFPKGGGISIGSTLNNAVNNLQKDKEIKICEILYRKVVNRTLVLTNFGRVFVEDEDFLLIKDELESVGEVVESRRKRTQNIFISRKFDGGGWLTKPEETVFEYPPIIPIFGNYKVIGGKIYYRGAVSRMRDIQRTLNYSMSRMIQEVALQPTAKIVASMSQIQGQEDSWSSLNVDNSAVLIYNPEPGIPPPYKMNGPEVNVGLQNTINNLTSLQRAQAGLYEASMGQAGDAISGAAIGKLQERGDAGIGKYIDSFQVGMQQTARVLLSAIPKVYDSQRYLNIPARDGTLRGVTLNQRVLDRQTGTTVLLNDLTKGSYKVTTEISRSYANDQRELIDTLVGLAQYNPEIIQSSMDIILQNLSIEGSEILSERARSALVGAGVIPQNQLTEEELEQLQAAQQQAAQQGPDAASILAQAEMIKAQAAQQKVAGDSQIKQIELQLKQANMGSKQLETQIRAAVDQEKLALQRDKQEIDQIMEVQKLVVKQISEQADVLKTLVEAFGVSAIVGPDAASVLETQIEAVASAQKDAVDRV